VAAEEERERAAAKKGGAVLGVRVIRATAPAPPADSLRLTESKRGWFLEGKGGSGAGQGAGSDAAQGLGACGRVGPRPAAERPAGGEEKQRRVGHWRKEERGKEALTRGAGLAEREMRGGRVGWPG
jgi:hypothetical protein